MITENCLNDIKRAAVIENVIGELVTLNKKGSSLAGICPFCNENKFSVSPKKEIWKCYKCQEGGVGSISFIMKVKTNNNYVNAIKYLANKYNITLEYQQQEMQMAYGKAAKPNKPKAPEVKKAEKKNTFRDDQLIASGLTEADQKYMRTPDDSELTIEMDRYQAGTKNERGEIIAGDDMVMYYMDLYGKHMTYRRERAAKDSHFIRIRWQHPELHTDENGKAMKYQTPYQGGTKLWINQTLRNKFQSRTPIKTLFVQEGEKKADKATKHGMISAGIPGINNIAYKKELPHEFELIIKTCEVENMVFFLDADYLDLSDNLNSPIDKRPRNFLTAISNFRKYFYALNNSGINLNIYFAYILPEYKQKGIDDFLVNVLKGTENLLLQDLNEAMIDPNGKGKYVNCHNITTYNDFKLRKEFFHWETNDTFVKFHFEKLKDRKIFTIGNEKFKFSTKEESPDKPENTLILAQPLSQEEIFWSEHQRKRGESIEKVVSFKYKKCRMFLQNRRFGRYLVGKDGEFNYIRIEDNTVAVVKPAMIKDYVIEFAEHVLQIEDVSEMLERGTRMYFSDNLTNLHFLKPNFHRSDKGLQYMYFNKSFWKITAKGIEEKQLTELDGHVWKDKIRDFSAKILKPIVKVVKDGNKHKLQFPAGIEEAKKCVMFNYFMNTSNFHWRKTHEGIYKIKKSPSPRVDLTELETEDVVLHFISKCTGFAYMLHEYFDANTSKAIICQDGVETEVNSSNGRSGKSLLGYLISKLIPTEIIPGKPKDLTEDKFIYEDVTERTRAVIVDDARINLDIEFFFSNIVGIWKINPKGAKSFQIPRELSPKLMINTNHSLNGDGTSFSDRQFLLAFSDYYSSEYRPVHEHGALFYDEWDTDQMNQFFNFAAVCLQIYFEHGLVAAPMERLEKRRLRQQMGESFVEWAQNFFDPEFESMEDGRNNLNREHERSAITENFYTMFPEQRKYCDKRKFKKSLEKYCHYKEFVFNPGKQKDGNPNGGDDRRNSKEYFTIAPTK